MAVALRLLSSSRHCVAMISVITFGTAIALLLAAEVAWERAVATAQAVGLVAPSSHGQA